MEVLNWNKPKKIMSEETRRASYSSDSGIPGTYMPNMSREAIQDWKAKLKYAKNKDPEKNPQVEIRKDSFVLVVSLAGGYRYNNYGPDKRGWSNTSGRNMHLSSAGPIQLSWNDWDKLNRALDEAVEKLGELRPGHEQLKPDLNPSTSGSSQSSLRWVEKKSEGQGKAEWVGRITKTSNGRAQAELNKDGVHIVASLRGGYEYKWYKPGGRGPDTSKLNLHIAMNQPLRLDWEGWRDLKGAVMDAKMKLAELDPPQP